MSETHHEIERHEELFDSVDGVQSTTTLVDEELLNDITGLVESRSSGALRNIMLDLLPADIAEILNHLEEEQARFLFNLLSTEEASEVILDLQDTVRESLVESLSAERLSNIVEELDSDDAADIVSALDDEVAHEVLQQLEPEESAELRELLGYAEDTAGGLMATEFPEVLFTGTAQDAIESVRSLAEETQDIYEVYVVDKDGRLRGTVGLKNLILVQPNTPIASIMDEDVISVRTDVDQEDVANVMRKYDLLTLPVVNAENKPVGIITFDDIADVIHEEAIEDIQRMSGTSEETKSHATVFSITRGRLPWLLVGFIGEILAAIVLSSFQASIEQVLASAFFIPVIMAMGGNSGIQSSSIVVRGLATGELALSSIRSRLWNEFAGSFLNGAVFGVLLFGIVFWWIGDVAFGSTVALSLLVVIINATLVGAVVPFLLDRMGIDPALATGPFITTSNDALGLFIYLGFLTLLYL